MVSLRQLLEEMMNRNASDLHLTAGVAPVFRVDGSIEPSEHETLTPESTANLAYSVLSDEQRKRFETTHELDFSFGIKGLARFRANCYLQRGVVSMAIRVIPFRIIPVEELNLPMVVREFTTRTKGLVLVTGPTGSGKSTTLAALIDRINLHRACHIMTIEDPIEYVHHHKRAIVNQREVQSDTDSFPTALKYILRQDPDVILIGEMRDRVTFEAALTIAETGHLVFATLHTNSTMETVNRVVDAFPADQHKQVYTQLGFVLEGVVSQRLIPKARGGGRAMVSEVLVCTPAVRAIIREGKTHQLYSLMQAGQKYGMQTMNQSLLKAVVDRQITADQAMESTSEAAELEQMMQRVNLRAA